VLPLREQQPSSSPISSLRVIAVHHPPPLDRFPLAPHGAVRSLGERRATDLRRELRRAVESSRVGDARDVLREGDPGEVLAGETNELGLLVVGSRGYGPIGSALLGSIASRLLHTAACPVIVIPRGADDRLTPPA
jgi:nucleotide-binding universal stress UspA family protein